MKVLVIEDDAITALILADTLREMGHEADVAVDGDEGWHRFREHGYPIVILDWMVPGLDGPEICRRVRADSRETYTYLILLTGRTDPSDRLEGMEAGADDFLLKPVDPAQLRVRLQVASRILQSELSLRSAHSEIRRAREKEVALGSEIQRTLLLGSPPPSAAGLRIECLSFPSESVAGDFVDFYQHGKGVTSIVSGDVMGKGIPAAMVAAGVKSELQKALIELSSEGALPDIEAVVGRVGQATFHKLVSLETFVTLCYAQVDASSGRISYVNCGHPPILHWSAWTDEVAFLSATSAPIGFVEDDAIAALTRDLEVGDLLVIFSDGVTDMRLGDEAHLGPDRFARWVRERAHRPIEEIVEQVRHLHDQGRATDDFTCILTRMQGVTRPSGLSLWLTKSELAHVRDVLSEHELLQDLEAEARSDLLLAFQEAASNAIRHARPRAGGLPLEVDVQAVEGYVKVSLRYPGVRFDPREAELNHASLERDGGMGLAIIDRCVDGVDYRHENGRNCLCLLKKRVN